MLASNLRLKKESDFKKVFSSGKSSGSTLFVLKYAPNHLKNSRFGVVVSNKVSKKAVVRNKLRRRIKAWLQTKQADITPGIDVVIIAKPSATKADLKKIRADLKKAFIRARILKK